MIIPSVKATQDRLDSYSTTVVKRVGERVGLEAQSYLFGANQCTKAQSGMFAEVPAPFVLLLDPDNSILEFAQQHCGLDSKYDAAVLVRLSANGTLRRHLKFACFMRWIAPHCGSWRPYVALTVPFRTFFSSPSARLVCVAAIVPLSHCHRYR